jgi:hypothetical protein
MSRLLAVLVWTLSLVLVSAAEPGGLKEFVSEAGRFSVQLPRDPEESKVPEENAPSETMQYQYTVGSANGAYVVSYQDNPNMKNADQALLEKGLADAQEKVRSGFGGKLLSTKKIKLAKVYPGLEFECEIPAGPGIYRSRTYLVNGRFYQVIAVGTKEFTSADEATAVLHSFKLTK